MKSRGTPAIGRRPGQSTTTQTGRKLNVIIFVLMAIAIGYLLTETAKYLGATLPRHIEDPERFEAALPQAEATAARQRQEVIRMEAAGTARL